MEVFELGFLLCILLHVITGLLAANARQVRVGFCLLFYSVNCCLFADVQTDEWVLVTCLQGLKHCCR